MSFRRSFGRFLYYPSEERTLFSSILRRTSAVRSALFTTNASPAKRSFKRNTPKITQPLPDDASSSEQESSLDNLPSLGALPFQKRSVGKPLPDDAFACDQKSSLSILPNPADIPKPSEIPFQPKVANAVQLVGSIGAPVQLQSSPNGHSALSVLIRKESDLPQFRIPVIFHGDLAKIAACHLKENDLVYITGQLSVEADPIKINDVHAAVQVVVCTLDFVLESGKDNPKKIERDSMWNDLVSNPQHWCDHRGDKENGKVNPKFPDFRKIGSSGALWLNSAPSWVFARLDDLEFSREVFTRTRESQQSSPVSSNIKEMKDGLWSDLVDNPNKWWDNRSTKLNPKQPDFKHKETGEALWLNSAPAWITPKLHLLGAWNKASSFS